VGARRLLCAAALRSVLSPCLPMLVASTSLLTTQSLPRPLPSSLCPCRLLDRWVLLGGARNIAEMFVPAMGALGRCAACGGL
jgi:hypothetical protein